MKKYLCYAGIDISKSKLDVSFLTDSSQRSTPHLIVTNDGKGIKKLLWHLSKKGLAATDVLFTFEDTGIYSLPLACFLSEQGLDYWMVPAIEIKRSKGISRGKTDKTDSRDIAFYSMTHQYKLRLGRIPEKEIMELKLLFSEREKLMGAIHLMESTQEMQGFIPKETAATVLKINRATVRQLRIVLIKIEAEMQALIQDCEYLRNQYGLINSIPGVGPQTAMYLIIVTKGFKSFENWRQLACYGGVAPFEYSSGSSIRGRTKVNHMADKKLKSLLQMCAMNAKKCDVQLRDYYERKQADGKPKMLVLNNIKCKLLARVFAVVNRGNPYINTNKFAA